MNVPIGTMLRVALRSLRQHALSTTVTVASAALACGLVMAVFAVARQSTQAFQGGALGFDAVLGARGSSTQLVLNTVYHLETSPGNIPWLMYHEIADDPRVDKAYPYVVGDNYRGFRIVGTEPELFDEYLIDGVSPFDFVGHGEIFDPKLRQAIVGSVVAQETGLRRGSSFNPTHQLDGHGDHQHDEDYVVVGVLRATNMPVDRVIWVPMEGMWRMEGHYLRGAGEDYQPVPDEPIPDEHKEVSAVMLRLKNTSSGLALQNLYNRKDKRATLAWPIAAEVQRLFQRLGWVNKVLTLVAYLVMFVAAGSLLASLYNTMNERRREFAILRSLGARRSTLLGIIVMESSLIAFLGAAFGFLVYYGILAAAAAVIRQETGVVLDLGAWHPALLWTPIGMVVVGAVSGCIPAIKAYSTDVARVLSESAA
ncbi:MAG: putative ABC transport system permease protein [Planctomycetota bacterium]|jgi:putative ABC transport system permease protein